MGRKSKDDFWHERAENGSSKIDIEKQAQNQETAFESKEQETAPLKNTKTRRKIGLRYLKTISATSNIDNKLSSNSVTWGVKWTDIGLGTRWCRHPAKYYRDFFLNNYHY